MTERRGTNHIERASPSRPPRITGGLTSSPRKTATARGSSPGLRLRPSSPTVSLVAWKLNRGSPVAIQSKPSQMTGAAAASKAHLTGSDNERRWPRHHP
jgi:hypothetical protein